MASSLYNELRIARDQNNVAPDATDGVLLLIARVEDRRPGRAGRDAPGQGHHARSGVGADAGGRRGSSRGRRVAARRPPSPLAPPASAGRRRAGRRTARRGAMSFLSPDRRPAACAPGSAAGLAPAVPSARIADAPARRRDPAGPSSGRDGGLLAGVTRAATDRAAPVPARGRAPSSPRRSPRCRCRRRRGRTRRRRPRARTPRGAGQPEPQPGQPRAALADFSDDVDVFAARENADQLHARCRRHGGRAVAGRRSGGPAAALPARLVADPGAGPSRRRHACSSLPRRRPRCRPARGPYFSVFAYSADDPSAVRCRLAGAPRGGPGRPRGRLAPGEHARRCRGAELDGARRCRPGAGAPRSAGRGPAARLRREPGDRQQPRVRPGHRRAARAPLRVPGADAVRRRPHGAAGPVRGDRAERRDPGDARAGHGPDRPGDRRDDDGRGSSCGGRPRHWAAWSSTSRAHRRSTPRPAGSSPPRSSRRSRSAGRSANPRCSTARRPWCPASRSGRPTAPAAPSRRSP